MAVKNTTLTFKDTISDGDINDLYSLTSSDVVSEAVVNQDGKPYTIVVIWSCAHANASALNGATAYAALPNGSLAFCGTTSLVKVVKGGTFGLTNGSWA